MNLPASTLNLEVEIPKHPIQRLEDLFFKADEAWYNSVKEATAAVIEYMKTESGISYVDKGLLSDRITKAVYQVALGNIRGRYANVMNAATESTQAIINFAKAMNWQDKFDMLCARDPTPTWSSGDPL